MEQELFEAITEMHDFLLKLGITDESTHVVIDISGLVAHKFIAFMMKISYLQMIMIGLLMVIVGASIIAINI